jgi:hypothetical protein
LAVWARSIDSAEERPLAVETSTPFQVTLYGDAGGDADEAELARAGTGTLRRRITAAMARTTVGRPGRDRRGLVRRMDLPVRGEI